MPIVVLLILLLLFLLVLSQNLEPLVPLVFLGTALPQLPIALWILVAFGIGLLVSLGFSVVLTIAHRRTAKKISNAQPDPEVWDDPDWTDNSPEEAAPPKPKAPDIDAEFRVITPPIRNLEDLDDR